MNQSRIAYLIVTSAAIIIGYLMASVNSNSGTATILIRAVTDDLTPVRQFTLAYKGPVSGLAHESEDGTLKLVNLPEGQYRFTLDSAGFQTKQWQYIAKRKTASRHQVIALKQAQPASPISLTRFQTTPFQPIAILTQLPIRHYDRIRIKLIRNTDAQPFGDSGKTDLIAHIFQAKPYTDALRDLDWHLMSETVITPVFKTITVSNRSFNLPPDPPKSDRVWVSFPRTGIYIIEVSAAKNGIPYHPVRFPVLVSNTQIYRDSQRRIHQLDARYGAPQPGTVYKAIQKKRNVQFIRVASLDQFNNAPTSLAGADFLVVRSQDDGLCILPNIDLSPKIQHPVVWIQYPSGNQRIMTGLELKSEDGIPVLVPLHQLTPPQSGPISSRQRGVIHYTPTPSVQFNQVDAYVDRPIYRAHTGNASIPVECHYAKISYQPGDMVQLTLRSNTPSWVLIEYPPALGGGSEWIRVNTRITTQRRWRPQRNASGPISVSMLTRGRWYNQLFPVPTAVASSKPSANPIIQVTISKLTPNQAVSATLNLSHVPPGSVGTVMILAGHSNQPSPSLPQLDHRFLHHAQYRRFATELAFTPVKQWFLPIQPTISLTVPPVLATGNWVIYALVISNTQPPRQTQVTRPIMPSFKLAAVLPTLARPNDTLNVPITLQNHRPSPVEGTLTVWRDNTQIATQTHRIGADSIHRISIPIRVLARANVGSHIIRLIWKDAAKSEWSGRLHVAPILLPRIMDRYQLLLINPDTPPPTIHDWIKQDSSVIWASTHPAVIRYISMKTKSDATFLTPDWIVGQRYEIRQLQQQLRADQWGSAILAELNTLTTELTDARTNLDIDALSPAALALLVASEPQNVSAVSAMAHRLDNPISAFDRGIIMGVLAKKFSTQYPDYISALLRTQPLTDAAFLHGVSITIAPKLINLNPIRAVPHLPTSDATHRFILTQNGIQTQFQGRRRILSISANQKWVNDVSVGLVKRLPTINSQAMMVSATDGPIALFKRTIPPQSPISHATWTNGPHPSLAIPVSPSGEVQQLFFPLLTGLTIKFVLLNGATIPYYHHHDWVGIQLPPQRKATTLFIVYSQEISVNRVQSAGWIQSDTRRQIFIIPGVMHRGPRSANSPVIPRR